LQGRKLSVYKNDTKQAAALAELPGYQKGRRRQRPDAAPTRGLLNVTTHQVHKHEEEIVLTQKESLADTSIVVRLAYVAGQLTCAIEDQGVGIRPEEINRIFDPLYRSDAPTHRKIGGTGLGLSIVAKACALLAIELTVQSELGQGSTFTLQFSNESATAPA